MRLFRALLPVLATATLVGAGASSAAGATLFTSAAHTTRVSVGATASISTTDFTLTSGASTIFYCGNSTFNVVVSQNSDTALAATVTSGGWTHCLQPLSTSFVTPWKITARGTSIVSGANTIWTNTTVYDFSYTYLGGTYMATTNTLTSIQPTGLYWSQPTTGTAPLCLVLDRAGIMTGPLGADQRVVATYCFDGAATAWSLAN